MEGRRARSRRDEGLGVGGAALGSEGWRSGRPGPHWAGVGAIGRERVRPVGAA